MSRATLLSVLALSALSTGSGGTAELLPNRGSGPYRPLEAPRATSTRDERPFRRSLDERKKRRDKRQARKATRRDR